MPYSGDPNSSPADEVRFLVGDTDASSPRLTDAEYTYLIMKYPVPIKAAYQAALRLYAKYSNKVSKYVGPTRIFYVELVNQYKELISELKSQGGITMGVPISGGEDAAMWSTQVWDKPGVK